MAGKLQGEKRDSQNPSEQDKERQLNTLISLSDRFGDSLANAFAKNIAEGKRFDDVLKQVRSTLKEFALRTAMAPLQLALTQGLKSLLGGIFQKDLPLGPDLAGIGQGLRSLLPFAQGGVVSGGAVRPFAQGGVVASPTYFPLGRGLGLMGERGAEAIVPLARGADGRLGVRSDGGGRPVTVNVTIATPDAESFRRSEAQVSAALARAVGRGQRAL